MSEYILFIFCGPDKRVQKDTKVQRWIIITSTYLLLSAVNLFYT